MINVIKTKRLILRPFKESDADDLYELLSRLKDDEFEGYPDITRENCVEYLNERQSSGEYYAVVLNGTGRIIGNIYCGDRDKR
jgi:RimJ/RimL family protein N-acetyltransferase